MENQMAVGVCRLENYQMEAVQEAEAGVRGKISVGTIYTAIPCFAKGVEGFRKRYPNVNFYIEDGGETLPFRMRTINLTKTNLDFPYNPSFKGRIKKAFLDCFFRTRPNIRRFYKLFSKLYKNKRKDQRYGYFMHSFSLFNEVKNRISS